MKKTILFILIIILFVSCEHVNPNTKEDESLENKCLENETKPIPKDKEEDISLANNIQTNKDKPTPNEEGNIEELYYSNKIASYKLLLEIPYLDSLKEQNEDNIFAHAIVNKKGEKIDELTEERGPNAFSIIDNVIYLVDTLDSSIIMIKNNKLLKRIKLEYPFTDILDILVINPEEMYIFNEPLDRGIYYYNNGNIIKLDSEVYSPKYKYFSCLEVRNNKAILGETKYLELEDEFEKIKERPWGLEIDNNILIDTKTNKRYDIFQKESFGSFSILGIFNSVIYVDCYDGNGKRYLIRLDKENNNIYFSEIRKNNIYVNRDIYVNIDGGIYQMILEETKLTINEIVFED